MKRSLYHRHTGTREIEKKIVRPTRWKRKGSRFARRAGILDFFFSPFGMKIYMEEFFFSSEFTRAHDVLVR